MTRTVIESKTRTTVIGFDQPFCVIGERINPTGRKILNEELERGDFSRVEADAVAQVEAGATVLDVNSGAVFSNKMGEDARYADNNFVEPMLMPELIRVVQAVTIARCASIQLGARRAEAGLEAAEGRPLVNSVTGEEERLEVVLPLVKKYNVAVVAISNDDTGISEDPDVRFAVAKKIVERAADFGIPAHDIVVDPLVMPIGAMATAGQQVFTLVRRLREELGREHDLRGVQHLLRAAEPARDQQRLPAHGLRGRHDECDHEPRRAAGGAEGHRREEGAGRGGGRDPAEDMDDEAFVKLFGMGSTKPRAGKEMEAIRAANFLMNHDDGGAAWIRFNKDPDAEPQGGRAGGRRRRRAG
jgi:5-methyltetrahydrofolate--homocysteine methyltransferase